MKTIVCKNTSNGVTKSYGVLNEEGDIIIMSYLINDIKNLIAQNVIFTTKQGGHVYVEPGTGILKTRNNHTQLDNLSSLNQCSLNNRITK